jgi:hypothetical protein
MALVVIGTLGVAFAAHCIWLTVRIANGRKKAGVRFWVSVVMVVVLVIYPLSIGPAFCWASRSGGSPATAIYYPIACYADKNELANTALKWYLRLWIDALK